ncbi:MAG TPA: hypothetical protein ENJ18_00035 [Nannocystis exedens]|nr:hypothetical protein [Nannocystis exedens]
MSRPHQHQQRTVLRALTAGFLLCLGCGDTSTSSEGPTGSESAVTGQTSGTGESESSSSESSSSGSGSSSSSSGSTDATTGVTTNATNATNATDATTGTTGTTGTTDATTGTTTDPTTGTTTGGLLEECPEIAAGEELAKVQDPKINEASGMVASREQEDVLWVHNDSGDGARVYAITPAGETIGSFVLDGVLALDWEDMAIGPGPMPGEDGSWLYLGDIGDNAKLRPWVSIYRIPEPNAADAMGGEVTVKDVETFNLVYPDGPRDAESLLVDPVTGELVIVSKEDKTGVYRLEGPLTEGGTYMLEKVEPVNVPLVITTAGDVSPLGDFVIVRTYIDAMLWLRPPGTTLSDAFKGEPCEVPLKLEIQGETLAIARDASGYSTLSEKESQPLWWFARQ